MKKNFFVLFALLITSLSASAQWLTGVTASTPTSNSTTISWTSCTPTSSNVSYGTTSSYGLTAGSATPVSSHSVSLTGLASSTTYHFSVSSADSTGAIIASKDFTFLTATSSPPPPPPSVVSLWPLTKVPASKDGGADNPVELGIKFTSDVAGQIIAIRFYKATANTGTHVGNVWSSNGTKLASITFTGETSSGWQRQVLTTPVVINAGTSYVISYHCINGHYSDDQGSLTSGYNNTPLHVPANGGVYTYGSSSVFPTLTFKSTNYYIDFELSTSSQPPPPPTLKPDLTWTVSTSAVIGYNVYRSVVSGSGYLKVNSSLITGTEYVDSQVTSGTYFYVATSVDSTGRESIFSNQISVVVP